MSDTIKRLRESRLNVWEQAKAVAERAADENRALDAQEQAQWETLNAELDALDRRMNSIAEAEKRAKETEEKFAALERQPVVADQAVDTGERKLGEELRAFLVGAPGSPRHFDVMPVARTVPTSYRDLSKLTDAAGKFTVPTSFYNQLVEHMIEVSGVLQAGPTILNTGSGEVLQIPKTLTHTPNPAIVVEAAAIAESDPTFGQTSLGAFKYGRMLQVTRELLTDTGVDLDGYLARSIGRALGNSFGDDLITGTGTTEPRGLATDSSLGFTPAAGLLAGGGFGSQATANQGFDILINVFHSVIPPYRASRSCAWVMNDTTAGTVRRIKNADGLYAWQPSTQVGAPDTILGKPVFIDPFVASPGANTKSIYFGDFSAFFVRYAGGIRFERSDDFAFGNDLVSFRALLRADAALVDLTGAVKHLLHPAT
ncbi:MAG: phage major capsid protein [Acidimicrobiia bacterium]